MKNRSFLRRSLPLAAVSVLVVLTVSCAARKEVVRDPFMEKWQTLAKESVGHSPVPRVREIIIPPATVPEEEVQARTLPSTRITLRMRQADIRAVLRSMARLGEIHLLVNDHIKGEVTFDFRDVPWDQAFAGIKRSQGLTSVWEGDILLVKTIEEVERGLRIEATNEKRLAQQQAVRLIEPLHTVMVNIDYADAKLLRENVMDFLTRDVAGKPRGSVRVDEHTNSLIIQAVRDDLKRLIPIIEKVDRPPHQVLIRANIVETTKEMARTLGVQWGGALGGSIDGRGLWVTPGGTSKLPVIDPKVNPFLTGQYTPTTGPAGISGQGFAANFPGGVAAAAAGGGAASLGLMFGTIGANILDLQLHALQRDGTLNILSSPSITTLDNQKAFTESGERVPFVTTDREGNRTVNFHDAVLRLEITPHVIDGENLKMRIKVKKDEVDRTRSVDGNPFVIKKTTETTLVVSNGETIVISGLTKQKLEGTDTGIPFLMRVPVLRWLFKSEAKRDTMEEVMIFITPTILPPRTIALRAPEKK